MKTINKGIITAAVLGASALVASAAQAAPDGTITFNGKVVGETCTVDVNKTGSSSATVTLPTVQTSALKTDGDVAGRTGFTMSVSGAACLKANAGANGTVKAFFQQGPNIDPDSGFLTNTATAAAATMVQIGILNATDATTVKGFDLNAPAATQGETPVTMVDGTATLLHYAAQYVARGQSTPGAVTSSVDYVLDFN